MIAKTKKQSLKIAKKLYPLSRKRLQGRVIAEVFDAKGTLVQKTVGETTAQLRNEHALGRCSAFCSFCVFDAERFIKENPEP